MDHLSKEARSALIAKIKAKDTKPELIIRKMIWRSGFRYRLYDKKLPRTPDIVFRSKKKVILVNGCFWHGHICCKNQLPKTRTEFWNQKISKNMMRDFNNLNRPHALGWSTLVLWECEVRNSLIWERVLKFLTS